MAAQLVTALYAAGYLPAAGGSVRFYQVGTTTPVNVYNNDAATQVITQPVPLDATGKPVVPVYSTIPMRAIIYDSNGAQLLDIERVDGNRAETVSIVNTGWPNEATADAALTALATSLGGPDGQVKVTGAGAVARSVQSKLSEQRSVTDFGAKGNGIADDTSAIVAGMTAVNAAGGGTLFFPAGTYLTSQAIAVLSGVSLRGAGATYSVIKLTSSSANCFTVGAGVNRFFFEDIGITNSGTSTGAGIFLTGASYVVMSRLRITGYTFCIDSIDVGAANISQYHRIRDCELITDGTNAAARCIRMDGVVNVNGSSGSHLVFGNELSATGGTLATLIEIKGLCSSMSVIANVSPPNNQAVGILINSAHTGQRLYFFANDFSQVSTNGLNIARATGAGIMEYANNWGPGVANSSDSTGDVYGSPYVSSQMIRPTGSFGYTQTIGGSASAVITPQRGNVFEINATGAGSTITIPAPSPSTIPAGHELVFMCKNGSGGAVTWTFNAVYNLSAAVNPGAGNRTIVTVRAPITTSGTPAFHETSRQTVTG